MYNVWVDILKGECTGVLADRENRLVTRMSVLIAASFSTASFSTLATTSTNTLQQHGPRASPIYLLTEYHVDHFLGVGTSLLLFSGDAVGVTHQPHLETAGHSHFAEFFGVRS